MSFPVLIQLAIWRTILGAAQTSDLWEILQVFSSFQMFFISLGLIIMFIVLVTYFLPAIKKWVDKLTGAI